MSIIILGFMIACAIIASADGIKLVRCKSTHRHWNSPVCSMRTESPDNERMCTNVDVFAEVGGYFSLDDNIEHLCITYIFKSNYELSTDENDLEYPKGIWLYRSAVYEPSVKTCEQFCSYVRTNTAGTNYTNLYVGCFRDTDGNDEYVDYYWDQQTQYNCSTDDMYFDKSKPSPPLPPTTTKSTTPSIPTPSTPSKASTASIASTKLTASTEFTSPTITSLSPTAKPITPPFVDPDDPEKQKATLYVGIGEGVVGVVGTAFIVTTNVVLFLQLKNLRAGGSE